MNDYLILKLAFLLCFTGIPYGFASSYWRRSSQHCQCPPACLANSCLIFCLVCVDPPTAPEGGEAGGPTVGVGSQSCTKSTGIRSPTSPSQERVTDSQILLFCFVLFVSYSHLHGCDFHQPQKCIK